MRRHDLASGETYHIFSRSIAEYRIFGREQDYLRMVESLAYYRTKKNVSLCHYLRAKESRNKLEREGASDTGQDGPILVDVVAYCIMPTHVHVILRQQEDNGISTYMSNVLNSYTRYFNICMKRSGPLWESRFKSVLVETDDHLLHLTRYLHLNPVTACLVEKPELWPYSSYHEYCGETHPEKRFCSFNELLDVDPLAYRGFVNDQISYQRDLARLKQFLVE